MADGTTDDRSRHPNPLTVTLTLPFIGGPHCQPGGVTTETLHVVTFPGGLVHRQSRYYWPHRLDRTVCGHSFPPDGAMPSPPRWCALCWRRWTARHLDALTAELVVTIFDVQDAA
jgi:hypothetical protein